MDYRPAQNYYHITSPDNIESIEREGIRRGTDEGIFVFSDLLVAETIATHQLFIDRYALFVLLRGAVTGPTVADEVGEFSAPYHAIIQQEHIAPEHLVYLGTHPVRHDVMTPWLYFYYKRMGCDRREAESQFKQFLKGLEAREQGCTESS